MILVLMKENGMDFAVIKGRTAKCKHCGDLVNTYIITDKGVLCTTCYSELYGKSAKFNACTLSSILEEVE